MTPGHSKDICFLWLQITRSDTGAIIKWKVSLVIADGHFNLQGFMGQHTASLQRVYSQRIS